MADPTRPLRGIFDETEDDDLILGEDGDPMFDEEERTPEEDDLDEDDDVVGEEIER
jgi:hypothetical protein